MKEYIERAVAVQELEVLRQEYEMHDDCDELVARRCRDALSAVPAADVAEVVRCKDCQYYQDAKINKKGFLICPSSGMEITETDYCSYGARMGKPRICEVLGVEVNQNFQFNDFPFDEPKTYFVGANGEIRNAHGGEVTSSELCYIINNADYIIRKPRWTEQEVELAKTVKILFPEASDLARMNACALALSNDHGGHITNINSDLFPSLPLGLCVKLDEIIGGAQ